MKVLITRPPLQADTFAKKLRSAGFEPIHFPVIEIRPVSDNIMLDRALSKLSCYEWIVFTSVNAVEIVFDKYPHHFSKEKLETRFVAIGPKTADALRNRNIEPDFIPEEYVSEAILPGLGDVMGKWILLPRAEIARADLPEALADAGAIVHEIIVYQTSPAEIDWEGLNALKAGVDVITFTSASTVDNFVAIARENQLDPLQLPNNPLFACIGPITEQAARRAGLQKILVAQEYTTDGLIAEISKNVYKETGIRTNK